MTFYDNHPVTLLFNKIQEHGEDYLSYAEQLGDDLPHYTVLLPALFDWIKVPEAIASDYIESYESALFLVLQSLRVDLREHTSQADFSWGIVQAVLSREASSDYDVEHVQMLLQMLAELDFQIPEILIEHVGQWQLEEVECLEESDEGLLSPYDGGSFEEMLETVNSESAFDVYDVLKTEYYYLPASGLSLLLQQLLRSEHAVLREAGFLFLLHPRAALRDQTLSLLPQAGIIERLDATARDRLVMLRNWLPTVDSTRVDSIIKQLQLRNLPLSKPVQASVSQTDIWACAMDGVGALAVIIMRPEGKMYRLSSLVLKEGVGILDCWQIPADSKVATKKILKELLNYFPHSLLVTHDYLEILIPHYLALNCSDSEIPSPKVLEWLENLGVGVWQPNRFNTVAWLQSVDAELVVDNQKAAYERCQNWFDKNQDKLCWESYDSVEENIIETFFRADVDIDTEGLDLLICPFRSLWRDRFIYLAIRSRFAIQKQARPLWQDFALLALNIERGDAVCTLPILADVARDILNDIAVELLNVDDD